MAFDYLSTEYFVEKNGIQSVILCIKNNPTSDVTRHGIAILFDIMRETSQNNDAATQARVIGFQEGLNELLMECTDKFEEDVEVRMMCQQILGSSESFAPTDKFDID